MPRGSAKAYTGTVDAYIPPTAIAMYSFLGATLSHHDINLDGLV